MSDKLNVMEYDEIIVMRRAPSGAVSIDYYLGNNDGAFGIGSTTEFAQETKEIAGFFRWFPKVNSTNSKGLVSVSDLAEIELSKLGPNPIISVGR